LLVAAKMSESLIRTQPKIELGLKIHDERASGCSSVAQSLSRRKKEVIAAQLHLTGKMMRHATTGD